MITEKAPQPQNEAFSLDTESLDLVRRIEGGLEAINEKTQQKVFTPEAQEKIKKALWLAIELHSDQEPRDDGSSYIAHILRATNQVLNSFKVTDPGVIAATLLHDSIEDQREKLAEPWFCKLIDDRQLVNSKTAALRAIAALFGIRTFRIVEAVTKPDQKDFSTREERDREYLEKLKWVLEYSNAFYVKLADFYDNVLSLENAGTLEHQKKRAKKYDPVFSLFVARIQKDDIVIPSKTKEDIVAKLLRAQVILRRISATVAA